MRFQNSVASALLFSGISVAFSPLVLLLSVQMGACGDWPLRAAIISSIIATPVFFLYFYNLHPGINCRPSDVATGGVLCGKLRLVRECSILQLTACPFVFPLFAVCCHALFSVLLVVWASALVLFVAPAFISLAVRIKTPCPNCGEKGMDYKVAFDGAYCRCKSCTKTWGLNTFK